MSRLTDVLELVRASDPIEQSPTWKLKCTLGEPATSDEIAAAWGDFKVPADVLEFWSICSFAKLFVPRSSQWGIELMSPQESRERTEEEQERIGDNVERGDMVIGKFHGEMDVLIRKGSPGPGLVLAPDILVDDYCDWWVLGETLPDFIEKYVAAEGQFWWEGSPWVQPLVRTWPQSYGSTRQTKAKKKSGQ